MFGGLCDWATEIRDFETEVYNDKDLTPRSGPS
jgi:hypothetical protein